MKQVHLMVGKTYKASTVIKHLAGFNITMTQIQYVNDTCLIKFKNDALMMVFEYKHSPFYPKLKHLALWAGQL